MKIKAKRSLLILLTFLFAISVFAVTAFATGTDGAITPGDPAAEPVSQVTASEPASPGSSEGPSEPLSSTGPTDSSGTSSAPESSSSAPSSSIPNSSHAQTTSSSKSSSKPTQSVDTHASRVEAIASQAAGAMSDPDVLSSQNWNELLSSGSDSAVPAGTVSGVESASSTPSSQNDSISWLLILGIVLLALGVGGVVFFVYAQFISNKKGGRGGYGGPIDISSNSSAGPREDTEPITTFEDISSDSDGTQHRDSYVPSKEKPFDGIRPAGTVNRTPSAPPMMEKPAGKKQKTSSKEDTMPLPQEILPNRKPAVPPRGLEAKPMSQATPVQDGKDFDWEKFFNDDSND